MAIPIVGNMFSLDRSRTHEILTQVDRKQLLYICSDYHFRYCVSHLSRLFPVGRDIWERVQPANGPDMDGGGQQF